MNGSSAHNCSDPYFGFPKLSEAGHAKGFKGANPNRTVIASGSARMVICKRMTKSQPNGITGDALESLLSRRKEFLGFLERRVGSRATAEDILQSAFVRGIERGGEIREQESVVAWFYRLLRNAVIDHYRRKASSGRAMEGFAREVEGAEVPSPDLRNEICQCVSRVLTELKPEYREALEVVDVGEASLSELAIKTGISANNATVRVHRARQALQKQVKLTCGACAEHGCVDCRCKSGHPQS
jgi:RNA polymerase sigma factor (sigma-70 family)